MAKEVPSVYCVVLNLNGCQLLLEAVASLKKMPYPNFNIVVVDNGSTDGSQEALRTSHSDVHLIENGQNLGFGEGNNVGMRYAVNQHADWVLLLNNDIVVHPNMLTELMKIATNEESIGVLTPKIYYHSANKTLWYAGGNINFWTGVISHRGIREEDKGRYDHVEDTQYITGCAFLVKKEVLEKVGMFDPVYYPIYSEDADLSERTRRAGYRLVYVPSAVMWHKVSAFSGGGLTPYKTRLKVEHNLIFFKRYAEWYHWLTIPWCIGGYTIIFIMKELVKGNIGIIVALIRGFLKAFGRLKST